MRHALEVELLERLLRVIERGEPEANAKEASIPSRNYHDAARLERERSILFRRYPLIVGRARDLAKPGDYVTQDVAGLPVVVLKDKGGELRAFVNACRHRGSKLLSDACGETKGIVCRYHAWTYDLSGALIHVPLEQCFPTLDRSEHGLVPLPVEARHGFLWVTPTPGAKLDVGAWLGPIDDDLGAFALADHHAHRSVGAIRAANWKLVIDAFLEGYHVRSLHRDSIYRFFRDDTVVFDHFAPHVRSAGARRTVLEISKTEKARWNIREHATVFYHLFPNTVLVFHPDWLSRISLYPETTGTLRYEHDMLIPRLPRNEDEEAHYQKSFDLIDGRVFQKEDLTITENIQAAIGGAGERFLIGKLEYPIKLFHDAVDEALR